MIRLLLDHPWPPEAATDARSDGYGVLLKFIDLVRSTGLSPARFVEPQDSDEAIQRLNYCHSGAAAVRRFLPQIVRHANGGAFASPKTDRPDPVPPFSDCWKRGLRDELEHLEDWRSLQIVVPEKRRAVWPDTAEVPIQCEDRPETPPQDRVLVALGEYGSHPFAIPDSDPWRNLEWLKRPQPGARVNYPCRLPKPPIPDGVPVEELVQALVEARNNSWPINGRYYFIPPADFHPERVSKEDWRNGAAFERRTINTRKGKKTGPIDFEGRIWAWDIFEERHWDVQMADGEWLNISHDGRRIR